MKDHWALPREAPALPPDGLLLNPVIGWQHEVLNAPPIICDMGKKKKKRMLLPKPKGLFPLFHAGF